MWGAGGRSPPGPQILTSPPSERGSPPQGGHQKVDYRVKLSVEFNYDTHFPIKHVFSLFFDYLMFLMVDLVDFSESVCERERNIGWGSKKISEFFSPSKVMGVCQKSGCEIKYNIPYKKFVKICCPLNVFFSGL